MYTQIGWYDRLPQAPKAKPQEQKRQPQPISSTGPESDDEVDESSSHRHSRSPTNSSQRSMKNNAYVDIKSRTSAGPSRSINQEISISPLTIDSEDSDTDDIPLV
jgi:hypothetical protein